MTRVGASALARVGANGEFFVDNLLVRIHLIIVMIKWIGLVPWEFEISFAGSLTSTFQRARTTPAGCNRFLARRGQLERFQILVPAK